MWPQWTELARRAVMALERIADALEARALGQLDRDREEVASGR